MIEPSKLFESTYNGIHLNVEELKKLQAEYENTKKQSLIDELKELKQNYQLAEVELSRLTEGTADYNLKLTELNGIQKQIDEIVELSNEYEGLTSSYNKWILAQSGNEEYDRYSAIASEFEDVKDLIDRGWTTSNRVTSFMELIFDEDVISKADGAADVLYDRLDKKFASGYTIKDFFKFDDDNKLVTDGIFNFLDTVQTVLGSDYAWKVGKKYFFDFKGEDDKVAKALGLNVETVQAILEAATNAGFKDVVINVTGLENIGEVQTAIEETENKVKELNGTPVNIDIYTEESNLDSEIKNAEKIINELNSKDNKVELDNALLDDAKTKLDYLYNRKLALAKPSFMSDGV